MIEIILSSFNQLFNAINIFLQQKDLTLGAILAGVSPFIVLWIKISNEKGKKAKQLLIERRQLQIAFNVNEIMEKLGVDSKWNLQEIESTHQVLPNLKRFVLLSRAVTILRRKKVMDKLKSRKFWLTILAALIPVLNAEFNIHLDITTMGLMMSAIMAGVGFIAHVDAKKILAGLLHTKVTPNEVEIAYTTFKEAIPYLKTIHDGVNNLLEDVKKDDGSQAFKDALQTYESIRVIIEANKHPEPLPEVTEQVSA